MLTCLVADIGMRMMTGGGSNDFQRRQNTVVEKKMAGPFFECRPGFLEIRRLNPSNHAVFVDDSNTFDNFYFKITEKKALKTYSRQIRNFYEVVRKLTNTGTPTVLLQMHRPTVFTSPKDLVETSHYRISGKSANVHCSRIPLLINVRNISIGLEVPCSSSSFALYLMQYSILNGESQIAITDGANIAESKSFKSFHKTSQSRLTGYGRNNDDYLRTYSFAVAMMYSEVFFKLYLLHIRRHFISRPCSSDRKTLMVTYLNSLDKSEMKQKSMKIKDKLDTCHGTDANICDHIKVIAVKKHFNIGFLVKSALIHENLIGIMLLGRRFMVLYLPTEKFPVCLSTRKNYVQAPYKRLDQFLHFSRISLGNWNSIAAACEIYNEIHVLDDCCVLDSPSLKWHVDEMILFKVCWYLLSVYCTASSVVHGGRMEDVYTMDIPEAASTAQITSLVQARLSNAYTRQVLSDLKLNPPRCSMSSSVHAALQDESAESHKHLGFPIDEQNAILATDDVSVIICNDHSPNNRLLNLSYFLDQNANELIPSWFRNEYKLQEIKKNLRLSDLTMSPIDTITLQRYFKKQYLDPSNSISLDRPFFQNFIHHLPSIDGLRHDSHSSQEAEQNDNILSALNCPDRSIGILAVSCRLPGGVSDASEFWNLLKAGVNTSSRIPANRIITRDVLIEGEKYGSSLEGGNFITQDVSGFDADFFNISVSEAETIDPQQRLLLECVQECIENAGLIDVSDIGVFIGLMEKEYTDLIGNSNSIFTMLGSMSSVISGRISYVLGSYGPSMTVDTACSSSLVAVELAINALNKGRCSRAIVAGVNLILSEKGQGVRANGKMLSHHGMSLSFDACASGYGRSDGCAVIILEKIKPNVNYLARIVDVNVNHGGTSSSLTTPNPFAHKILVKTLLRDCPPSELQYWEAHGTGTRVGDPIELNVLSSILDNITIGTVKTSIGHGEASAGAIALLKLVLMLQYNYIPSLNHFHILNSQIDVGTLRLPIIGENQELKNCGMTSFGVSGTNAAAIIARASTPSAKTIMVRKHYLLTLSAKNEKALAKMIKEMCEFVSNSDNDMEDIAGAVNLYRKHYTYRCALIVNRHRREMCRFLSSHSGVVFDKVVITISNSIVSYDILQIPLIFHHFVALTEILICDNDKLLISFIQFMTDLLGNVEFQACSGRELVIALMALSFLPISESSIDLLKMSSISDVVQALAMFGITQSNNEIVKRSASFLSSHQMGVSFFEVVCGQYDLINHYNLLSITSQLYINGFVLDFSLLFDRPMKYVRIPTYSFDRQSLWFSEKPQVFEHYLLGIIKEKTDTLIVFRNWLDDIRHPQLLGSNSFDKGAVIEIVQAALACLNLSSICIEDLKIQLRSLKKPSWLLTKVRKLDRQYEVSAQINQQDFFFCRVFPISERVQMLEFSPAERKLEMRSLYIPEFKNSKITITNNLHYATVDCEFEKSPYGVIVEISLRMNPGMSMIWFQLFSTPPSCCEIFKFNYADGAVVEIYSGDQVFVRIYMKNDPCFSRHFTTNVQPQFEDCSISCKKYLEMFYKTLNNYEKCSHTVPYCQHEMNRIAFVKPLDNMQPKSPEKPISTYICTEILAVLSEVVRNHIGEASLIRSDDVFDHDLDSLTAVDFVHALNQRFPELNITIDDVFEHRSVSEISQFISTLYSQKIENTNSHEFLPCSSTSSKSTIIRETSLQPNARDQNAQCPQFDVEDTSNSVNSECDEVLDLVIRATQDILPKSVDVTEESLYSGFMELGLDSLGVVDLVSRLNNKYFPSLGLSTTDIFDHYSIKKLSGYIKRKKATAISDEEDISSKSKNFAIHQVLDIVMRATQDILPKSVDVTEETIHTGFMELGLDSLAVVDLVSRLNEKYFPTMRLSTTDIFDYPSINKLAEHIWQMHARCNQRNEFCEPKEDLPLASQANPALSCNFPIADIPQFSSAYIEIFEDSDVEADMLLSTNELGELFLVNLDSGRKFVLNSREDEMVSSEPLIKLVPSKTVIRFSSDGTIQPAQFFSSLLFLSNILLSTCTKISITVSKLPTLANTLASSFFKTLAAEKYPKLRYIYTEHLLEVRIPNDGGCTKIGGKWLITGGLSGIGLAIARWLVDECNAEDLVLVSRRSPDKDLMLEIDQLRKKAQVIVISANIADYETLHAALSRIPFKLTGVIHSAGVLRDGIMERQSLNTFLQVFSPKGEGYHIVDRILEENHHNVSCFIVMSSFTVVCGNVGQLNYAVANAYLDHQMYLRRQAGKPGTAIHWGNWLEVGMAKKVQKTLKDLGFLGLTNKEAFVFMKYAITHKPLKLIAAKLDWNSVLRKRPDIRKDIVVKAADSLNGSIADIGIPLFSETSGNIMNSDAQRRESLTNILLQRKHHNQTVLETSPIGDCRPSSENDNTQKLHSREGYVSVDKYCTVESQVQYTTEKVTSSKPSDTQLNICNIFGLNVFFDDEEDFNRSVTHNIEYLMNCRCYSMLPSFKKLYAIHVIGKSIAEIVSKLKSLSFRKKIERNANGKSVMLFAGQGAQYPFMGKQLSTMFPVFRKEFQRCLAMANALMKDVPLSNIIDNVANPTLLHLTKYVQPIMFAFGCACATLWRSLGFEPDFYLGHSVGEIVAGVMAEIITLEDGIRIIVERGIAMENIAGRGALLAMDSEAKEEVLGKFNVHLTAINSPKQVVIAGRQKDLDSVLKYIKGRNMYGTFVNTKYPFHSSLITEDDVKGLRKILRTINFRQARVPIVSNVTGNLITTFSEEYLIQHTISAVKLVDCVHTLKSLGVTTWVEAGPSNTVTSFVRSTLGLSTVERHDIMQTASDLGEEARHIIATALMLEARGVPIRWESVYQCENDDICLDKPFILFPQEFSGTITDGDYAVLKNHRVNGETLVPGVYQIYLLLKWINTSSNPAEYCTLIDTKFINYWKLEEARSFQLTRTSANMFYITVNGKITCTTHVRYESEHHVSDLDVSRIRQECTTECNVNDFYRNIAINGLDYRKQFQNIKLLKRSETCTYSVLQFEEPYAVWTLMDAALHAVCPSVIHRRPDVYFVPIAIEEIYWNDKIDPFFAESIVAITNKVAENEKFIQAHACILVDDKLLFHYKNKLSMVLRADYPLPPKVGAARDIHFVSSLEHDTHSGDLLEEKPEYVSTEEVEAEGQSEAEETGVYILSYDGIFFSDACDTVELWQRMKIGALTSDYKLRDRPPKNNILIDTDITLWDPEFFAISPKEARYIDVVQRLMMKSVLKCMERASWTSMPKETGVFIGMSGSDFTNRVYSEMKDDISGYFSTGTSGSCIAGRISHWLNTEGPAIVIDTACSSSFTALINALDAIIQGRCKHAIVGGVNIILHDTITQVLKNAGMLSATGKCQVFDADADGYVRSEAVGCILLSKYHSGTIFKISYWAIGHNGRAASLNVPNGNAQERIMQLVNKTKVDDVECHGTGTALGDPIEARVVSKCYSNVTISSAKALVGHSEAASGIVSLIHSLLQMKHNYRCSQVHFKCPNPKIDFSNLVVPLIGEKRAVNRFAINNFGFSGTNCSIVVEKHLARKAYRNFLSKYCLAPISSANKHSLQMMIDQWKVFVNECDQGIVDICTKLQRVRSSYKYRHCFLYDYKRKIVWETGKNFMDAEEYFPIAGVDFIDFFYGSGYGSYHSNGLEDLVNFCKRIISGVNEIPTLMTPIQFHQFIANEYVRGHSINWSEYNPATLSEQTVVPSYMFNNRRFWPFKEQFAYNFTSPEAFQKAIYYERTLIITPTVKRDLGLPVINVGKAVNISGISYYPMSAFQSSLLGDQTRIVLFHPYSSSIDDALTLISIWQLLEVKENFVLIVACQSNGTSYTEWTALCRTLASERLLRYKFVSYSTVEDLEAEFSCSDVFECVFYKNSHRHVERLVASTPKKTSISAPKHLLITGGTGGIGKMIVRFLNPLKTTIATRSIKNYSDDTSERFEELVEWDLLTLDLPKEEHYDLVVHCAGAVENALMAAMDYSKFESVSKPKCCGLATIFEAVKDRCPKKIVIASSVAAIFGSIGQANYAFANGLMTSMAEKSTLSTQVIHWGPWENVGMLQGTHFQKVRDQLSTNGWDVLDPTEALMALNSNAPNMVVFKGDFKKLAGLQVHLRKYLSEVVPNDVHDVPTGTHKKKIICGLEATQKIDASSLEGIIIDVSGIDKLGCEKDTPLMNLGIDSLMIEKIRANLSTKFGCAITSKDIYDNCTVDRLSKLIAIRTGKKIETIVQSNDSKCSAIYHGDIAIIACSGAFSGCECINELWKNLLAGNECIVRKETQEDNYVNASGLIENTERFDYKFWKMTHDDASMLDPQIRVFLQHAYHALEKSGYIRERSNLKIGVFAGAEPNEYGDPCEEAEGSLRRMFKLNMKDYVSTFAAHMLNLRGPAIGIYSACSTALVAITQACNSLRLYNIDLAIAGGISLVLPGQTHYEIEEGLVVSKSGVCRPFDNEADGIVRGSSVGCVVLKRLDQALHDNDHIEAVIRSFGLSNDGLHKASFMAPNSEGQKECIREALASLSETDIKRIRYIECHGTGTLVGDEIEIEALKSVYGKRADLFIGSVKANIGHGFAGAGMAGIFKTVKILQEHIIPPQININLLREDIPFIVNRKRATLAEDSLAAVSSFGIGGTNVHIVISQAPHRVPSYSIPLRSRIHILPISGETSTACIAQCRAIATYLKNRSDGELEAVAATLQYRREHFRFRVAFAVRSIAQAVSLLDAVSSPISSTVLDKSNICFFFSPQGVQYPNMEKESLNYASVFKEEIERLVSIASELFKIDFMEVMYPENSLCDRISEAKFAQVATFIISRAVLAQLDNWKISSDLLLGHSVGEYAAACYSDILDEYSCLKLLKERGEMVSRTDEARLLAISESKMPLPDGIEVTAHLSDTLKCVAGTPSSIEAFRMELDKHRVSYRELATRHGFHSSMMDSIREEFLFLTSKLPFRKGNKKVVSNINGAIITEFDYQYCWSHMREPVDLKKCLDTILDSKKVKVIVEVGPSGVLKHLLAERGVDVHVVNTVLGRRKGIHLPLHSQLYQSLADLWTLGYDVNFRNFFPSEKFDQNLPVYQFDRQICWRESITKESARYFKASWSPVGVIQKIDEHIHNEKILLLSNKGVEFVFPECELCRTYTHKAKPSDFSKLHAEELSNFTLIIYLPDDNLSDVAEPFLLSQKICSIIVPFKTRLIVISHTGEATHWTTLGPIRQHHLGRERKNIFVDNAERVPISQFLRQLLVLSEEVLLATSRHLFGMSYADDQYSRKRFELGKTVVIIGGNGAIGQVYVDVLRRLNSVKNIVVASRHSKEISALSDVVYITMDICNETSVRSALNMVRSKYGDIGTIIHTAGVGPSQSLHKTIPDMLSVISPKVFGITNIIEYFCQNNLVLDNLLMASSLTSILPLQGTEDYAASNIFMDALALNGHPNIKRVLAVQWPAWRDRGMTSTYGKSALQTILLRTSISRHTGRRVVMETLNMSGVVVYSSIPPLKMRQIVEKMQLMGEGPQPSVKKEHLSMKEKVALVWSEILCTEISDDSDFFGSGGNSLSALRVVWNLNKLLVTDITVDLLFKYSTLRDFVEMLPSGRRTNAINFFDVTLSAELSYAQENMYLLSKLQPGTHYNIIFSISFRKSTSKFCFQKLLYSVHSLIARQHSLRSIFIQNTDSSPPNQVVFSLTECYQNLTYNVIDQDEYTSLLETEESFIFNLSEIPLRIRSVRLGDIYVIFFNQYHIVTDGWSMTVLAKELKEIYSLYSICEENKIKPKSYSISEYAHWQRQNVTFSSELEELKLMLREKQPTVLPQTQTTGSRSFNKSFQIIPESLVSRIKSLAKIHCTTNFVITLSTFVMCLRKFKRNDQDDSIVIGYPTSGRNDKVEDIIGYFLNNTVISLDIRLQDSLEDVISKVKHVTSIARKFEHVPFHRLVAEMGTMRQINEHPVFQIYFNYRHQLDFPVPDFPDANVEINQLSMNKIFDFSIAFDDTPDGTRVMIEYNSGKYQIETIEEFMVCLLHHIRIPRETPLNTSCFRMDYPSSAFSKYLASSRCRGKEIAIRRRNSSFTYEALQDHVTSIADWIDDLWIKYTGCCVRSDDIITIEAASNDAIVVIMAVLRIGAAYAPIDPSWPQSRRKQIGENIGFGLQISKPILSSISKLKKKRKGTCFNRIAESDLIYVLHTSGTTGTTKGVALSHKNISCFLRFANAQTLMRAAHRVSHSVNIVFDVSVMNILGSLLNASELLLHDDIRNLPDELKAYKCNFAFLTSAMFNALTKSELQQIAELEKLFVGGEAIHDKNLLEAMKLGLDITEIYGPTESTIWSLTNRCKALVQEGSLIGLPMPNEVCWIKYNTFEGELIIGGAKVARGYLNNCVKNKFSVINGVPCYCTGDKVRYQREGFIYIGRMDREMKVRGHRVEGEEVEKLILTCAPQISQVSVVVSDNTLLAFVVHNDLLNESTISLRLKNILPSFMVPSRFISMSYLPLNTSGKVDKDMLLKEHARLVSTASPGHSSIRHMMSLTELKVASIFENLLNAQNVASDGNFFTLGGHSLLLFELKSQLLQSFAVDVEVHELFNNLTVGSLAELVTKKIKDLCKTDTSIITKLRENDNANFNIYFIHAIGGSIFPYYAFVKVFPKEVNLYAIEYQLDFKATTLKELAAFYANTVVAHTKTIRPFLVGHSMGGTIGREMVTEMRLWGWEIPFVVMFDTWIVRSEQLDIERVSNFAQKLFKYLPNSAKRTESTIRLAKMLKAYSSTVSPTKIYLFKSVEVGDAAFRSVVKTDLTEMMSRSMTANGLDELSTQPVDVWMIGGNHESCLRPENLSTQKKTILSLFNNWL